jgi:hypothetical protein
MDHRRRVAGTHLIRRLEKINHFGRESDSGLFSNFTSLIRDQLWTISALAVDGLGVRLRRFRKSHHLIAAGPGAIRGIVAGSTAQSSARRVAVCVSTYFNG